MPSKRDMRAIPGEAPMRPLRFLASSVTDAAQRQWTEDEEFRAWHRQPDALPVLDDDPDRPTERRPAARRVTATLVLGRIFGRRPLLRR
jgi:hypothetical protein